MADWTSHPTGTAAPLAAAAWLALTAGQAAALVQGPLPQRVSGLKRWDVIGPFPSSSREQGADVLEAFGGILQIPRGGNLTYPSELVSNWAGRPAGRASWLAVEAAHENGPIEVNYGDMRWSFMAEPLGESVARSGGWAVSDFNVSVAGRYSAGCLGVSSFLLDGRELLTGDPYRRGWPAAQAVHLEAGNHTLYVPFAAWGSRKTMHCQVLPYDVDPDTAPLAVIRRGGNGGRPDLFPDVIEGRLNSWRGSVVVENRGAKPLRITQAWAHGHEVLLELLPESPSRVAPSQKMPLHFLLHQEQHRLSCVGEGYARRHELVIGISATDGAGAAFSVTVSVDLICRDFGEPYKFTFVDADKSVQYAAVRSPEGPCPDSGCAVLFATHGASVESDPRRNPAWAFAYNRQKAAWVLLPTNRDSYGYDWQMAGMENGLRALQHLAAHLPGVPSNLTRKMRVDSNRLLYSGHSMGGHGCLEFLTHHGDRALAAAPAAGWISFRLYVFDNMRTGDNLIDPVLRGILYSSIAEWNTDLYVANAVGVPALARVGGNDTSVPPWHLRRFARLLAEESGQTDAMAISEVAGKGHWFGGVVGDAEMQRFYDQHLGKDLPALPRRFSLVTLNPATSGTRGGIKILQLEVPYRLARIHVDRGDSDDGPWQIATENVRRFTFVNIEGRKLPAKGFVVDGAEFAGGPATSGTPAEGSAEAAAAPGGHYCALGPADDSGGPVWQLCRGDAWESSERSPSNYGPMRQVFEAGPLIIVYGTGGGPAYAELMERRARFVADTAYYRGRFAIELIPDSDPSLPGLLDSRFGQNLILLGGPDVNALSRNMSGDWPLRWSHRGSGPDGSGPIVFWVGSRRYAAGGMAALFLAPFRRPAPNGHRGGLALVVAGTCIKSFGLASKLLPLSAGLSLPDYLVVEPTFAWRGAGGVVAAGFYDNHWRVSDQTGYSRPFAGGRPAASQSAGLL